jgi:hypothetical protein
MKKKKKLFYFFRITNYQIHYQSYCYYLINDDWLNVNFYDFRKKIDFYVNS